jgi:hypothetical protein
MAMAVFSIGVIAALLMVLIIPAFFICLCAAFILFFLGL